jgi:hypothetical protein
MNVLTLESPNQFTSKAREVYANSKNEDDFNFSKAIEVAYERVTGRSFFELKTEIAA